MAEKKNIVIKLKFPKGALPEKKASNPKMITEWNYTRIIVALIGVAAVIGLALHFLSAQPPKMTENKQKPEAITEIISHSQNIAAPATQVENTGDEVLKKKILRAQLTAKIVNSEPVGELSIPVKAGEKAPVLVYFFAELADMKGKTIYHEWLLEDKLISKKLVNISDKTWRTSSRQMVAYTTNSNWTVRLVDEAGMVLTEKKFTVVSDK
jgi:Protein of unknown function (DUF2914)